MRQEFDREFDALLRRAAAREAARGHAAGRAAGEAHLDADEMSAFAEGSLPEAARAASVSHLADCAACRRAVASLASASGASPRLEQSGAAAPASVPARASESAGPSSWRAWLSALFAPRFLRYAAPALALCVVGVVSFVALRSGDRDEMSARSAAGTGAPAGATMNADASSANMNASVAAPEQSATANANLASPAAGDAVAARADARPANDKGDAAQSRDDAGGGAAVGERSAAVASERVGVTSTGDQRLDAAPAAPPAPAPADERRAEPKKEGDEVAATRDDNAFTVASPEQERARSVNQIRGAENQQSPDGSRNQQRSAINNRSVQTLGEGAPPPPAREAAKAKSPQASDRQARGRGVADARTADEDSSATRSVEGRRFRRQGGVWVDVNYRDSLPSVGVRRGTEAYRALVAELPEVGRVAEALAGEVVVVARGRAYRIK